MDPRHIYNEYSYHYQTSLYALPSSPNSSSMSDPSSPKRPSTRENLAVPNTTRARSPSEALLLESILKAEELLTRRLSEHSSQPLSRTQSQLVPEYQNTAGLSPYDQHPGTSPAEGRHFSFLRSTASSTIPPKPNFSQGSPNDKKPGQQ